MEHVLWTSHHPKDIKKGTFTGEMSRLATLNSTASGYSESISDLVSLYLHRGYPHNLLKHWVQDNFQKCWNNHLSNTNTGTTNVFVLKSQFNPAWTLFNVKELGDIITGSWRSHLNIKYDQMREHRTIVNKPMEEWLRPTPSTALREWMSDFLSGRIFDVFKAGLCDNRFLVSRKQIRNLFDLSNTWKKSVLSDTL